MAKIYISLGSNIDRDRNTRAGIKALRERFGELELSSVYESEAVGFEGDAFYNMVIGCEVSEGDIFTVKRTVQVLKRMHWNGAGMVCGETILSRLQGGQVFP